MRDRLPEDVRGDQVDLVLAEWRTEQPRLDTSPIAVVARIGRACALLDRGLNENFGRFGLSRTSWRAWSSASQSPPTAAVCALPSPARGEPSSHASDPATSRPSDACSPH